MTLPENMSELQSLRFFSQEYGKFRKEVFNYFNRDILPNTTAMLDPMSGGAPLLPIAQTLGVQTVFSDMLPVHYYVNRAKNIEVWRAAKTFEKINKTQFQSVLYDCLSEVGNTRLIVSDGWFPEEVLIGLLTAWEKTEKYPELVATLLKALILLSLRGMSSVWTTQQNHYWHRPGGLTSDIPIEEVISQAVGKFRSLWNFYDSVVLSDFLSPSSECLLEDVTAINLNREFDTIITSPPYPNRFDYLRMFGPELYFLSKAPGEHQSNMDISPIASNSVVNFFPSEEEIQYIAGYSKSAEVFLCDVAKLGKERENNYYHRYFSLYYLRLFKAIESMVSVLSRSGSIFIVAQDNIHRGELNPLVACCEECLSALDLGIIDNNQQRWLRSHQGTRNISKRHPVLVKRHKEVVVGAKRL